MNATEKDNVEWLVDQLTCEALCPYANLRKALERKGIYELQHLAGEHDDPLVRLRAGLLLAALDGPDAGEVLALLAEEDPDEAVRAGAAEELSKPL